MRSTLDRDVAAAVADESRRATDPTQLQRAVAAQVARAVPYDLWCGLTTDPRTGDPTGGFHEEGLPFEHMERLLVIEQQPDTDFGALRELVPGPTSVMTLARATEGDLARSSRYRDVFVPSGVRHEVRAAMRGSDGLAWGAMVLMRGTDLPDFSARELALLAAVGRVVADGIRRVMALTTVGYGGQAGAPGLVLCSVGDAITVDHVSDAALPWLDEIEDGRLGELPVALGSLVHAAHHRAGPGVRHRVRLRTRSGGWLTAYAERLGDVSVSVILEASRPEEVRELLADAFRLTAREREVAVLAAGGLTNREIAAQLYVSAYTVADHLKAVFAKTGARSRAELAAGLPPGSVRA